MSESGRLIVSFDCSVENGAVQPAAAAMTFFNQERVTCFSSADTKREARVSLPVFSTQRTAENKLKSKKILSQTTRRSQFAIPQMEDIQIFKYLP